MSIFFLAFSFVLILPLLIFVARVSETHASAGMANNTWGAVKVAFSDRSYTLLFFGFFVCGFHVQFIQTHLPAYIIDEGLTPIIGAWSLALIGLFNIAGSFSQVGQESLSQTKTPLWHLSYTRDRHNPIYHGPTNGQQRPILFGCDGYFVAVHSTADHRINRTDPRIAISLHIGGSCVL